MKFNLLDVLSETGLTWCLLSCTGDQTMIGKIATLATDTATHRSTLQVGRMVHGREGASNYLSARGCFLHSST